MPAPQTVQDITQLLSRLEGASTTCVQVLGINSLKSISTPLSDLEGAVIDRHEVNDRIVSIFTDKNELVVDLQRTGKLVWRGDSGPYQIGSGPSPTVRIVTANGTLDMTEPAKTKRITLTIKELSR